eukprot:CAMPEP_0119265362 /NCGR_PEP_ID=MMETSP1329-20130426/4198_1 /TAXON_ID=114041 /ORGANISM="Genus nov. species nov., Strain RCC1024" /LENGTH=72 /DNA_ID=CAMNT_0007265183 /DNA_START=89 /DNA_END=303 /DNA_ORIENTATION=+
MRDQSRDARAVSPDLEPRALPAWPEPDEEAGRRLAAAAASEAEYIVAADYCASVQRAGVRPAWRSRIATWYT